ncbi:MAG: acyltransferase family protein [Ignavibacteriales bacterium]
MERNKTIDVTKGIAIILVVIGHCIQYGMGSSWINNWYFFHDVIFKLIYGLHMPLFILISGYLFFSTIKKRNTIEIIKSRIFNILIPIFLWVILYKIIDLLIFEKPFIFDTFFYDFFNSLWFLWAIFYISLIVLFVNKIFKDNIFIYVLINILLLLLTDKYNIALYSYLYPYFIIAYFYHKYQTKINQFLYKINDYIKILISGLSYFILMSFYNINCYIYIGGFSIINKDILPQLKIDIYRYAVGFFGCIFILSLITMILKSKPRKEWKTLTILGQNSLAIYTVSCYLNCNLLLLLTPNAPSNYYVVIIESILMIGICLIFATLIKKIRILNKLLLGGR